MRTAVATDEWPDWEADFERWIGGPAFDVPMYVVSHRGVPHHRVIAPSASRGERPGTWVLLVDQTGGPLTWEPRPGSLMGTNDRDAAIKGYLKALNEQM